MSFCGVLLRDSEAGFVGVAFASKPGGALDEDIVVHRSRILSGPESMFDQAQSRQG